MNRPGVLLDTGPLVAFLDRSDAQHTRATTVMAACQPPFRTCEAVIAEAAHLLRKLTAAAPASLAALGRLGLFTIALRIDEQWAAIERTLMKYRTVPADLADACLIRCAEVHREPRILTFDDDFEVYRWAGTKRFAIVG
jgi:predicted nucleic acid-binding protein